MLECKATTLVEKFVFTCGRCGRVMGQGNDISEWQERFIISFRAGYGSIFGDGNYVEGVFCQECIQSLLGQWLRVTEDDPFKTKYKSDCQAEKLLQSYQLKDTLEYSEASEIEETIRVGDEEKSNFTQLKQLAERLGVLETHKK